jgi:putative tryptophan/tyrosine transport system substrate-binding protein
MGMFTISIRYAAFLKRLQQLGWTNGQNVRVEARWSAGDAKLARQYAAELIALTPDVMVTTGSLSTETVVRSTTTLSIVFAVVLDPVGSGLIKSLSRPGDNATGFMMFECGLSAKWPELLKQIAPSTTRAAVCCGIRNRLPRGWSIRCHPIGGVLGWRGDDSNQSWRRLRHRARD